MAITKYAVYMYPEIVEAGYPQVYDVPLDHCHVLSDHGVLIPQWISELTDDRSKFWSKRIAAVESTCGTSDAGRIVYDRLTAFAPTSLVIAGPKVLYRCTPKETPDSKVAWFLLGAHSPSVVSDDSHTVGHSKALRDAHFLSSLLFGFHEDYPPCGGHWLDSSDPHSLLTESYVAGLFGEYRLTARWDPSLQLFIAGDGDALVMNMQGEWGWWESGSTDVIRSMGDGMSSLAQIFGQHLDALVELASVEDVAIGFDSRRCKSYLKNGFIRLFEGGQPFNEK